MHDLCEKYVARSEMLLRLLDDNDLGLWVKEPAKAEIRRLLGLPEPEPAEGPKTPMD